MGNATFTADQEGIFQYYCMYHPQTMRGQLVVLPSSAAAS
jgi:plastocyanin